MTDTPKRSCRLERVRSSPVNSMCLSMRRNPLALKASEPAKIWQTPSVTSSDNDDWLSFSFAEEQRPLRREDILDRRHYSNHSCVLNQLICLDLANHNVTNLRRLRWPSPFILCDENFSSNLKEVIASGDIGWYNKSEILHNVASQISKFTDNPNSAQRKEAAHALITKYPSLKSSLGDCTHEWCIRIYDKMREVRQQKRKLQTPDNFQNENTKFCRNSPKVARRSRGEINWAPLPPDGEDAISFAVNEEWLRKESKKIVSLQNKQAIIEKMELCFANRRNILNGSLISMEEIKKLYPFLFTVDGFVKEFSLLMAFDIDKSILSELQNLAPKLLKLGNLKKKMPPEMLSLLNDFTQKNANEYHINNSFVIGILLLPFLLAEDGDLRFKMIYFSKPLWKM